MTAIVGCACAAAASRKSRLSCGRQRAQPSVDEIVQRLGNRATAARHRRRRRCAAVRERSPGRRTGCHRTRPSLRREPASAGSVPDATARRVQSGGVERADLEGPDAVSRAAPRRSSSTRRLSSPARREQSNPTRSDRSRRPANARPPAEAGSSHWTSSIATTTGRSSASARNALRSARPIACGSGGGPSSSSRTSASESARLWPAGRAASASSSTVSRRSPMPENDSAVSLSAGRATRMRNAMVARLIETGLPEGGLPDPGFAFERERQGTLGDAGHEPAYGRELGVPSHDAGGHDPTIVRPMPCPGKPSADRVRDGAAAASTSGRRRTSSRAQARSQRPPGPARAPVACRAGR